MQFESSRRGQRALPLITLLLLSLLSAGCGVSSTRAASTAKPTIVAYVPTPQGAPTVTATPYHTATSAPPCDSLARFASATRAGDLLLTNQSGWGGFTSTLYSAPGEQLPDATPAKPLQVQYGSSSSGYRVSAIPATNPKMQEGEGNGGGYEVDVCNASATQSHTIQSVFAQLNAFAQFTGSLQELLGSCASAPFDAASRLSLGNGCGGGPYSACEYVHATFPTAASMGAKVVAAQTGFGRDGIQDSPCPQYGPLPVTLGPGGSMSFDVGVTAPTAPGTYTFLVGFVVDGAPAVYVAVTPVLLAPAARLWSGYACEQSTMQAQIPTTSDHTYYICPQ